MSYDTGYGPVSLNSLADLPPVTKPVRVVPGQWSWDRACDWCGAAPRQQCTTGSGRPAPTHAARTSRKTAR